MRRAPTPTPTRWKTPPATRPTRASTTTSTPIANSLRCAPSRKSLEKINEKKSLLYFSGGISRDGIENQASLRAAINAAVRANLAIYSVDTRGLQAISPLGDASTGSLRGTGAYNGGALQNNMNANFATQEVMATLSSDTGGKAFFDSNDFAPAFAQVQRDTSAYYAIGFHSTNPARDGKYRKLTIKINRPGIKLEYRPGYYAPADFKHSGKEDRERELEEQLASDLPATDMAVYLDAMYFRLDENRFYVPVSLIVPGSQIPFVKGGDKDKATLDIIGAVIDEVKRPIGRVRETVKLNLDPSLQARQKNIQYTTSFNLPPGKYHLKFVVRENQTGRMGSFEADITLPEMKKAPLKMSSIVLASHAPAQQEAEPAGAQRRGVRAQHQPRLPPGPAPVSALRGLLARRAKSRPRISPREPSRASTCSAASNSSRDRPRCTKRRWCRPRPSTSKAATRCRLNWTCRWPASSRARISAS